MDDDGLAVGAIIGIVIGVVMTTAIFAVAMCLYGRARKNNSRDKNSAIDDDGVAVVDKIPGDMEANDTSTGNLSSASTKFPPGQVEDDFVRQEDHSMS